MDNIIYSADFALSFAILGGGIRVGKIKINVITITKMTQKNIIKLFTIVTLEDLIQRSN